MLLSETVSMYVNGNTKQQWLDKGYIWDKGVSYIDVSVSDLPEGSHARVKTQCDRCGEISETEYRVYKDTIKKYGDYYCKHCNAYRNPYSEWTEEKKEQRSMKFKETMLNRYGTTSTQAVPEIRAKSIQTSIEHFGVEHPYKSQEIKDKAKETNLKKYGAEYPILNEQYKKDYERGNLEKIGVEYPFLTEESKERSKEVMLLKYGEISPMKVPEFVKKAQSTLIEKYGVTSPAKNLEIRKKMAETRQMKGSCPSSPVQDTYFKLYKHLGYECYLNYVIGEYSADIVFPKDMVDMEIDYSGHRLSVKFGSLSNAEFDEREEKRNKYIEQIGYRIIRIIANKARNIPDINILQNIYQVALQYLNLTNETRINFDIDKKNYSCRNTIIDSFDFGQLHQINYFQKKGIIE